MNPKTQQAHDAQGNPAGKGTSDDGQAEEVRAVRTGAHREPDQSERVEVTRAAPAGAGQPQEKTGWWHQPTTVWAVAFAAMVSFMGIGLVDPILPAITEQLGATSTQTSLLFTSYLVITAVAMFFTSWVSGKIGTRNTLLLGLALIVAFALLSGLVGSVNGIIAARAVWGLGNALFISTALSTIVSEARSPEGAIILYEAALGVGMAVGPLAGGLLGSISWRAPFIGTAVLMAIAFVAIAILVRAPKDPETGKTARPSGASFGAGLKALTNPGLLAFALVAVFYNMGFFTILSWTPYPLGFKAMGIGLVFFGWGLGLALTSVLLAPVLTRHFRRTTVIGWGLAALLVCLVVCAFVANIVWALVPMMVVSGGVLGVMNTVLTEASMEASDLPRPVASSAYSGVRFLGGSIAPPVASALAVTFASHAVPYLYGATALVIALVVFFSLRGRLALANRPETGPELEQEEFEAEAVTYGSSD